MEKPMWNYSQRVNHKNFSRMTHPNPKRNIVLRAVLMRKGLVPLTTARPVNTVQPRPIVNSARPMSNPFNKAHSSVRRPFNNLTTKKNSNFYHRVNTVKGSGVNTARPKEAVNAARPKAAVNAARQKAVVNTARPDSSPVRCLVNEWLSLKCCTLFESSQTLW
ncbi:hypothetical protein Tco_1158978 [Tanacetum coccineum]